MTPDKKVKILATLGPATRSIDDVRALVDAGVNLFRLNFSHGEHADHAERFHWIRQVEREQNQAIGILMDLQGPKLRVGRFAGGRVQLERGQKFRLDLDETPGDQHRVMLPHPEIIAALEPGMTLLIDDGRLRLTVLSKHNDVIETRVMAGGELSDRKGVNVPEAVLELSPLTAKDRRDLAFGLELGVDWVALSFVQRPQDIHEARELIGERAFLMAKIEKPSAVQHLPGCRTPSWWRAATSAWRCRPRMCRASRRTSCASAASSAARWWWPRRCSNPCASPRRRPARKSPTSPTRWPKAPTR